MAYVVSQLVDHVFLHLCKEIDTPKSLAAWLLFSQKEHLQLVQLEARPSDYLEHDVQRYRDDYLICEYFSKAKFLQTGVSTAAVGASAFHAGESACARTNVRLRAFVDLRVIPEPLFMQAIMLANEKISDCIGTHVPWARIQAKFKWGKGATFSLKGEDVRLDSKLLEKQISVTQEALPYLRAAMATDYGWLRARGLEPDGPLSLLSTEFKVVRGSRGLLVPKNAKTDRFIAAEPSGNVFLQLGVGQELRRCLHRVGISLNDQSINQDLARRALDLGLATVDLKQASDTICRELVWLLLPPRWASFLDSLRSHELLFEEKWHMLSKFSSMGNGFTFELETLIFWALTEALRDLMGIRGRVSVYGDDIICPIELSEKLPALLEWVGFSVNSKKSHFKGVFRESCGKHYFGGYDVTPIYQKERPHGQERHRMVNRLLYHAIDRGSECGDTLLADRKLRFVTRIPDLLHGRRKYCRIPIQREVDSRSLDGGYAVGYHSAIFQYRDGFYVSRSWVFRPYEYDADNAAIYAVRARKPGRTPQDDLSFESHLLRRCASYKRNFFLWWVRKQQLRYDTEPLPFAGTVTRRGEGRWVLGRTRWPEACALRWI